MLVKIKLWKLISLFRGEFVSPPNRFYVNLGDISKFETSKESIFKKWRFWSFLKFLIFCPVLFGNISPVECYFSW